MAKVENNAGASVGRLILVRHGETEWSRTARHTGRTDIPLTEHGERQAQALTKQLHRWSFARVVVSPRARSLRTAELAGLIGFTVDDDLAEWDYGDYEGLTRDQIRGNDPQWTIWTGTTPGGETIEQVSARAERVIRRLGPDLADGDVLVVSHGHFGRVLATTWLRFPITAAAALHMEPAAACVLGDDRGQPVIEQWNLPNPANEQ
ncbi:MAG: histidine phosphatase family protein [Geodermatophilaceae bacterium]|jgi:probable phosphoglycerate mutase|nr:histidine phosphatase family protein [Geodermatophilaceae bacterium]